jgi:hypothetical protein
VTNAQPHVIGIGRRPNTEGAIRILARQHPLDYVADALIGVGVDSERLALGKLVDIEQWQGTADDLFGTAIRVAIERLKERRDVYPASEETASETAPVPGTKSAMRSLEIARLSPGPACAEWR